jgi:hypothetical protein
VIGLSASSPLSLLEYAAFGAPDCGMRSDPLLS